MWQQLLENHSNYSHMQKKRRSGNALLSNLRFCFLYEYFNLKNNPAIIPFSPATETAGQ